jgi:Transposase zinc-binding domain
MACRPTASWPCGNYELTVGAARIFIRVSAVPVQTFFVFSLTKGVDETERSTRQILVHTRPYCDRSETRPAVRSAFAKALQCRTVELGAEVFASENEEQGFCHTCKSRPCSSCGYRATVQWQRELGRLARRRLQGNHLHHARCVVAYIP